MDCAARQHIENVAMRCALPGMHNGSYDEMHAITPTHSRIRHEHRPCVKKPYRKDFEKNPMEHGVAARKVTSATTTSPHFFPSSAARPARQPLPKHWADAAVACGTTARRQLRHGHDGVASQRRRRKHGRLRVGGRNGGAHRWGQPRQHLRHRQQSQTPDVEEASPGSIAPMTTPAAAEPRVAMSRCCAERPAASSRRQRPAAVLTAARS